MTVNYQPTEVGLHNLHVFYNDEPLEGNIIIWIYHITITIQDFHVRPNRAFSRSAQTKSYVLAQTACTPTRPQPIRTQPITAHVQLNMIAISLSQIEIGSSLHMMCVYITGSPYQFHVDAVDSGMVSAFGPGLSYGVAGEPCTFTIDTKNAGAGKILLFLHTEFPK